MPQRPTTSAAPVRQLIVAMTGATGTVIGVRVLELLKREKVETHLIMSAWAGQTLAEESTLTVAQVQKLATHVYAPGDQSAPISSGSFVVDGMIVVPCSMHTLAAIAHGLGDNLIHRAADVMLKERRRLVLGVRESPLSDIHLENMLKLSRMDVVICPPLPAFYIKPQSVDDVITYAAVRLLDQVGIHVESPDRWKGTRRRAR
ncbi:MAG: UbiX family flavin prenyltransferase [Vicinamibacterales bacterium]